MNSTNTFKECCIFCHKSNWPCCGDGDCTFVKCDCECLFCEKCYDKFNSKYERSILKWDNTIIPYGEFGFSYVITLIKKCCRCDDDKIFIDSELLAYSLKLLNINRDELNNKLLNQK